MKFQFDENGNLPKDIALTAAQFERDFGYNDRRKNLITNLFKIAKQLSTAGCEELYVDGSFATAKELPNDIDVCIVTTGIDYTSFKKIQATFFTREGLRLLQANYNIHLFFDDMLEWFRKDRDGNKKGLIKLLTKEIEDYDSK